MDTFRSSRATPFTTTPDWRQKTVFGTPRRSTTGSGYASSLPTDLQQKPAFQTTTTSDFFNQLMGNKAIDNTLNLFGQQANPGVASPNTPQWAGVNKWDALIADAAKKYGVPTNLVKSIMRLESGGNPNARSPQGATGLMQVMPFHMGGNAQALLDPRTNIDKGVSILKQNYSRYGSWDMAAKAYLGLGGADAYGTTSGTYWNRIKGYWNELDSFGGQANPSTVAQGLGNVNAIFGGAPPRISQEFGRTGFSQSAKGQSMYGYVGGLGVQGHAGIDYSMNPGTRLYVPVSGTVITSGGRNFYTDSRYGARPGTGELRIKLDNGDELILGHMQSINLRVGQRVSPGTLAGLSGTNNGGHVHVEYRQYAPGKTNTNYLAVDPRKKLTGQFATGGQTAPATPQKQTYSNGLDAARRAALGGGDLAKLVYDPQFLQSAFQKRVLG